MRTTYITCSTVAVLQQTRNSVLVRVTDTTVKITLNQFSKSVLGELSYIV